jgi:hypothetical protein
MRQIMDNECIICANSMTPMDEETGAAGPGEAPPAVGDFPPPGLAYTV